MADHGHGGGDHGGGAGKMTGYAVGIILLCFAIFLGVRTVRWMWYGTPILEASETPYFIAPPGTTPYTAGARNRVGNVTPYATPSNEQLARQAYQSLGALPEMPGIGYNFSVTANASDAPKAGCQVIGQALSPDGRWTYTRRTCPK